MIRNGINNSLSRRQFLGTLAGGAAYAFFTSSCGPSRESASRPNIIYIMADDMGYADLSSYGRTDYQTPVLDGLVSEGVRFSDAYSIAPICTPTRVGFMTGRYPGRHVLGLKEPLALSDQDRELGLPTTQSTVSSLLKQSGYHNALFGKWHLGVKSEYHPNRHGIDEFFGPLSGAVDYINHHNVAGETDLYHNEELISQEGYLTDLITHRAVEFIRQRPEPFFLSLQYTAPHWPWQTREDAAYPLDRNLNIDGDPNKYPEMVAALDEGIGKILNALSESGLSDRTMVIFTSDNGGERYSDMGPFTGLKGSLREGGIRVPAFVRWPGVIPAGTTTDQVASTIDWTATILAAAGVSPDENYPLDGMDLLPIMKGEVAVQERMLCWRRFQRNLRGAIRNGYWKYLRDEKGEYLFNLSSDPGEQRDLKELEPDRFERLKAQFQAWDAEMLKPMPL